MWEFVFQPPGIFFSSSLKKSGRKILCGNFFLQSPGMFLSSLRYVAAGGATRFQSRSQLPVDRRAANSQILMTNTDQWSRQNQIDWQKTFFLQTFASAESEEVGGDDDCSHGIERSRGGRRPKKVNFFCDFWFVNFFCDFWLWKKCSFIFDSCRVGGDCSKVCLSVCL